MSYRFYRYGGDGTEKIYQSAEAWHKFEDMLDRGKIHPELDDFELNGETIEEITEPDD